MNKRILLDWLLVIILMIIIFMFSKDPAVSSSDKSNYLVESLVNLLNLKNIDLFELNVIIRKLAHFIIYFVLGVLVFNAVKDTSSKNLISILIISILICTLYAETDEFHQMLVPGRSGEIRDVVIDSAGSSQGALIYYLVLKTKNKNLKNS